MRMPHFPLVLVAIILTAQLATAQESGSGVVKSAATKSGPSSAELYELNLKSFDFLFEKVRDTAWDPKFDLDGWTAKRDELRAKIKPDSSMDDVREIMGEMIEWLGKSHFGVLPAELYEGWDEDEGANKDGHVGFKFRLVDGELLVTDVDSESDAHAKGVRTGWKLTKIDDKAVDEFVAKLGESIEEKELPTMAVFVIASRLAGEVGSELACEFIDRDDQATSLSIKRSTIKGEVVSIANLPKMVVEHEATEIRPGIGYLYFSGFFAPVQVMADLKQAIKIAEKGDGLIIDLRGNGGGFAGMTMGIGNKIANEDEEQFLGTLQTKDTTLRFVLIPSAHPYHGPVAVLTDECSASASEILAGGLQAIKRCRIFGTRTAGLALPSMVESMPNGDRLQYAFASYIDSADRCLEGIGVTPDEVIPLRKSDLLEEKDAVLNAAVAWINQQSK